MRTVRYSEYASDNGGVFETPVIDLFSGNLTTKRYENRALLGRYGHTEVANAAFLSSCSSAVISGILEPTPEQTDAILALSTLGVKVYIEDEGDVSHTIQIAKSVGAIGVFKPFPTQNDRDLINADKLKVASYDGGIAQGLVIVNVQDGSDLFDDAVIETSILAGSAGYNTPIFFYINTDPNHTPGEINGTLDHDVVIPAGTVVESTSGIKFFTVEQVTIAQGESSVVADVLALDSFDSLAPYSIQAHSIQGEDTLYVSNSDEIVPVDFVIEVGDFLKNASYLAGIACYATLYELRCESEETLYASEMDIYIGESVQEIEWDDTILVTTDTGTAGVDASGLKPMWFRNELVEVSEHDAGGASPLLVRTGGTVEQVSTQEYLTYSNDLKLDRYVQFSTDEELPIDVTVTLTDDGDRIVWSSTDRMADQLPLWMDWREPGSTGHSLINAIGRYANELFSPASMVRQYHLIDLNERLNGVAIAFSVDRGWVPVFGDVKSYSHFDGTDNVYVPIPMAADEDELLHSRVPAMFLSDGKLYIVNSTVVELPDDSGTPRTNAGDLEPEYVNLWTLFDEWGLMFNLSRIRGESLTRFRKRIFDVFESGFGSNEKGIAAAAERELSSDGFADGTFENTGKVKVYGVDDNSLNEADGFPSALKIKAVEAQRIAGVHTWDNMLVGKGIFDADGPGHESQGRLPYVYDTNLSQYSGKTSMLSGAGPGEDLKINRSFDIPFNPTVKMKVEGTDLLPAYTGRRVMATALFAATATQKKISCPPVPYRVKVDLTIGDVHYYKTFFGTRTSNVNANASDKGIGYYNTNHVDIPLMYRDRSGKNNLIGTWSNSSNQPINRPLDNQLVTSIVVTNLSEDTSKVSYWLEYADANHVHVACAATTGTLTKTHATAVNGGSIGLKVRVAPFDASTASSATWNSPKVPRSFTFFNTMVDGSLSDDLVTVSRPVFSPPYGFTNLDYTVEIVGAYPVDNPNRIDEANNEVDPYKIGSNVLDDLKRCITSTWNSATPASKRFVTFAFVPENAIVPHSFPYVREEIQGVSSTRTVLVPKLLDDETRIITLKSSQIPSLPASATEVGPIQVSTDTPGVSAKLDGQHLTVTRNDTHIAAHLYANKGYYWINGVEKYAYSYNDGSGIGPMTIAVTIPSGAGVSSISLPNHPANFTKTRVLVDGNELMYRFLGLDGEKVFSVDDISYTGSFYLRDGAAHFSETIDAGSEVTILMEPVESMGAIRTGVSTSPYDGWEERFFVAIDDSTPIVENIEIEVELDTVSVDRAAAGCVDTILVTARVLDDINNPVADKEVAWAVDSGVIFPVSTTTGADGRVTAYYSPETVGEVVIEVTADGISKTRSIAAVDTYDSVTKAIITASYPSIVMNGDTFNASIEMLGSQVSTVAYTLEYIESDGTENVEGLWVDITPMHSNLMILNGKARFTMPMNNEGLYKMTIDTAVLVWRVY